MYETLFWIAAFGIVLWAVIYVLDRLYDLESRNIELGPGMLMWRTNYGLGVLNRISNAWGGGWRVFGVLSAVSGVILMFVMIFNLGFNAFIYFTNERLAETASEGVQLVLPGVTIPFAAGIIALATVLLVHEPAHGVVLRYLGLKTKSTGLLLFLIIPGAFVEEDEDEFNEASVSQRIKVAGAGPFANVLFGIVCLLLVLALVNPLSGLFISGTLENTPAERTGLGPGEKLNSINGIQIENSSHFGRLMDQTLPNEEIVLGTDKGQYEITLEDHPAENTGYLGVYVLQSTSKSAFLDPIFASYMMLQEIRGRPLINEYSYNAPVPWFLINLLKWMFVLNLGVGLFNLLPLGPLDGGHIAEGIIEKITTREAAEMAMKFVSVFTLALIALNFLLPMFG